MSAHLFLLLFTTLVISCNPFWPAWRKQHANTPTETPNLISPYDSLFKHYGQQIDCDWRLLAAIAYHESHFDTAAVSSRKAKGLMQLMPHTARAVGVEEHNIHHPEENLQGAVALIAQLQKSFQHIPNADERRCFVLAAYNAGLGHIRDAQALTKQHGKNPKQWHGAVEHYVLCLADSAYFTDTLCHYGYLRGSETTQFVRRVTERYAYYQQIAP